jgi:hypothetical protein
MHWTYDKKIKPNPDKYFGFVYKITNKKTKQAYIGCKQYFVKRNGKTVGSNWKEYMGSSKSLLEDIKKIGKKNFTFVLIDQYENKRTMKYYELHYQIKLGVLTKILDGTDKYAYYNNYVGGRFTRPIKGAEEMVEIDKEKQLLTKQINSLKRQLNRSKKRIDILTKDLEKVNGISVDKSWEVEKQNENVIDFEAYRKKVNTTKEEYNALNEFMIECGYDPHNPEDAAKFWDDLEEGSESS